MSLIKVPCMQITNMHCSGQTVSLAAGDYHATIVTVGAGLAELTFQGCHLVIPHKPEEMPLAHLGKVLIPWPNRIANGCYRYQGQEYQLPINEHSSKAAIHGLLAWRDWQISELTATSVTLTAFLPPSYGYPFMLASQVVYSLNAHTGLSVEIASQNIGTVAAPYGVGIHTYLTCNLTSVDEYLFQLPANQVYAVDEHVNPTTLHHVDELDLNFTQAKTIAATKIDHTFRTANDLWEITITHPQQALSVSLCCDQPWVLRDPLIISPKRNHV